MAYKDSLFVIVFLLLLTEFQLKVIHYELYHQHKVTPYFNLKIGTPPTELSFRLSTQHSVINLHNDLQYDSNESSSYRAQGLTPNHPLIPIERQYYAIGKEKLSFSDIIIPSMPIVLVDEEINLDNTIGIGYLTPKDHSVPEYSFLYQLKLNHFIEKEMISIKAYKDSFLLSIGDYPIEVYTKRKQYKRCKLIPTRSSLTEPKEDNNPLYQCFFDSIFFDDNTMIPVKAKVTWLITGKKILIPMKVFDGIINKYFASSLESNECTLQGLNHQLLSCMSNYSNQNLNTIGLIIGKWSIKLPFDELFIFTINKGRMFFIFEGDTDPGIKESIEIGVNLFKNRIAIFNKEEGEFGLIEQDEDL